MIRVYRHQVRLSGKLNYIRNFNQNLDQDLFRTRLTKNDLLLGSYSYMSLAQARARISHSQLAIPIKHNKRPKVLFAGEATHHRWEKDSKTSNSIQKQPLQAFPNRHRCLLERTSRSRSPSGRLGNLQTIHKKQPEVGGPHYYNSNQSHKRRHPGKSHEKLRCCDP